jgi:HAD superfamily hydrolase (TIGR01484 family)
MSHFKLLVLDIDGTTTQSSGSALPSKRVIEAVTAAQQKLHVAVGTGRPYNFAVDVVSALRLSGPSVFNGGSEIRDAQSGTVLKRKTLSKQTMRELVAVTLPFGYAVYSDNDQYSKPLTSQADVVEPAAKFFIGSVKSSDAVKLLEAISSVNNAIGHPTTSWETGDVVDIHVTHIDGTKRHGIEQLMQILHIDKEHTMAIGDSHNDIPLLEAAGFKVAMGQAPNEVKALADYVTADLEHDGVAEAIEKFILS